MELPIKWYFLNLDMDPNRPPKGLRGEHIFGYPDPLIFETKAVNYFCFVRDEHRRLRFCVVAKAGTAHYDKYRYRSGNDQTNMAADGDTDTCNGHLEHEAGR